MINLEQAKFISIGFGSVINANKVVAIISPESAPIKRMISESRQKGTLIDATYGRKTRSVVVMDSGQVVLSLITPDTITARMQQRNGVLENE